MRFDPGPASVAEEFAAEVADVFEHRPLKVLLRVKQSQEI